MATDHLDGGEFSWRRALPWTHLFKGFQVAMDPNKLLLAAGGILMMHFGWWLLSLLFTANMSPNPPEFEQTDHKNWARFQEDRKRWNLMHKAAGLSDKRAVWEVADLANSQREYELFRGLSTPTEFQKRLEELRTSPDLQKEKGLTPADLDEYVRKARQYNKLGTVKPGALLSTGPWFEDRGPNPYLMVTGQVGIPWEVGYFWDWFARNQLLVMIEPLVKFVLPIIYLFSADADMWARFYFLLVTLWTLATWALFGGAISRIAVVQVARGEKIGIFEALRYTLKRYLSYLTAPLFPLGFLVVLLLLLFLFGLFHMIPLFGDIVVSGLFWPVAVLFGLLMAIVLAGLVSWPLMSATISAEDHDSWEAVSRSYSYVFQRPWQYLGYSALAVAYGAILVFFVGFMGSLTVYLTEWGVARIQPESRDPAYLFIYTPTSFGWRALLLHDAKTSTGQPVVHLGEVDAEAFEAFKNPPDGNWHWWNTAGAAMVSFWVGLIFLLVIGFGYSYFWSATSIIYLLMRKSIDLAEIDEVYLEEEDQDAFSSGVMPPAPAPASDAVKPSQIPLSTVTPPASPPAPETMEAPVPPPPAPPPSPPAAEAPAPPPEPPTAPEPPPDPTPGADAGSGPEETPGEGDEKPPTA